jgi:hypothetical protein
MEKSIWTLFWDVHSGGHSKEPWEQIYIEAPEEEAISVFYSRFGHNPERVTCTCCGGDYSIQEGELDQISGYHRNCEWSGEEKKYVETESSIPLETLLKGDNVIRKEDIKPEERSIDVPQEGYVWV